MCKMFQQNDYIMPQILMLKDKLPYAQNKIKKSKVTLTQTQKRDKFTIVIHLDAASCD